MLQNFRVLGKTQIRNRDIEVDMSQDNLAKLNALLKDPVRRKILLKLSSHEHLSFEDLKGQLKTVNAEELEKQLKILADLVTQSRDDEFLLTEAGVSKRPGGQYTLTEKGRDAVDEMLAFPEITAENYTEKVTQQYFSKNALTRRKLAYILGGAAAGYCIWLFGGGLLGIISVDLFHGHGWGSFMEPWVFFAFALFVAPVIGGFVGYWIGERKNFKRSTPEWDA